jgi:hypothetical protein
VSSYADQQGVWIAYDYDGPPHVLAVYSDPVTAARECAKQGWGNVGFMPFGWSLQAAINWWTSTEPDLAKIAEQYKPHQTPSPAEWILLVEIIKEGLDSAPKRKRPSQDMAELLADKISIEFLQNRRLESREIARRYQALNDSRRGLGPRYDTPQGRPTRLNPEDDG